MTDQEADDFFDEFVDEIDIEKKSETVSFRAGESLKKTFYNEVPPALRAKTFSKCRYEMKLAIHIARFNPNTVLDPD